MAQLKVTWKDGSREELVEVADGTDAAEYKTSRFGTPASEVEVVLVEAELVVTAAPKKPAAKKSLELNVEAE